MPAARNETGPDYIVTQPEDDVIAHALRILASRLRTPGHAITSPRDLKDYLRLRFAQCEQEVFSVLYLDSQHRVIELVEHFSGTLAQTSVYPRELVKTALRLNAGAVVLTHNHPSGVPTPSRADEALTVQLKSILSTMDVHVLDHIVIGHDECKSFAELGLLQPLTQSDCQNHQLDPPSRSPENQVSPVTNP